MTSIKNPILRGFNPDPSIIRVGDDYYIATSTFEWFPGVQIHHSKDLRHWQLLTRPLRRQSQLDLRGNPDSCGVWAPCLSYDKGTFYLVYSNVRTFDGVWKDTPNYLVTTQDITGDWSEPVFLNSSGFDASLFHDDDGKKWYLSMITDHRIRKELDGHPLPDFFGGIILQQYDEQQQKLVGPVHHIFQGTALGLTEGPHLYRKDGYYYLLTAEGGTEYSHAVSIARSKSITGPYEVHPDNPMVTCKHNKTSVLQKSGHGDLVETQNGDWYSVFLVGRPLSSRGRCMLGRETAIERFEWRDGWPYLSHGSNEPRQEVEAPDLPSHPFPASVVRDDFDSTELDIHFQSLRVPVSDDWLSLQARPGHLRLIGRESLSSFHNQSLLARRVQDFHTQASTCVEFEPESFQQLAGLVCYYNTYHFHYLNISKREDGAKVLSIISYDKHEPIEPLGSNVIDISGHDRVFLKVDFNREQLQFFYATQADQWQAIGPVLDGSILSDDYVTDRHNRYRPAFTGAFVGICCQDLSGNRLHADFDWFEYQEIND